MNKRIIIGSVLVLTLLLLMPSIPAIQQKVAKDEVLREIQEDLEFKDMKEILGSVKLDRVKHPILGLIVIMWMYFRLLRCQIIANISFEMNYDYDFQFEIHYPFLFVRGLILLINTALLISFFEGLSDIFGWNWKIPF